jgi:hypothetical protein
MSSASSLKDKVFISYRRDDSGDATSKLASLLQSSFGEDRVFLDSESIAGGERFHERIQEELVRAQVVLAIIGPNWLISADRWGRRRIDDSKDWVHRELTTALSTSGTTVIPVILEGGSVPPTEALPPQIAQLSLQNAMHVRQTHFRRDVSKIARRLHELGVSPSVSHGPESDTLGDLEGAPTEPLTTSDGVSAYVELLKTRLEKLQKERSFISAKGEAAAPLRAARINPSGRIEPGIPSLRFQIQARKLSLDELRKKYGGAELNYDDYVDHLAAAEESESVIDVVKYLSEMRDGWAIELLGAPGIGKSFIIRAACQNWCDRYRRGGTIPFLIELRNAPPGGLSSPEHVIALISRTVAHLTGASITQARDAISGFLETGRAMVFFDAIDELSDPVQSLRAIAELTRRYSKNRYVFSCRTFDQVPGLVAEELVLLPLSPGNLIDYVSDVLDGHPLLNKVLNAIQDPQFSRLLTTPLVASAFARFVRDRGALPKTLHETLSDALKQRFFSSALQHGLLDHASTGDDFDAMYAPVAQGLRKLAHSMRNQLVAPQSLASQLLGNSIVFEQKAVSPLRWAERAGILYETGDGHIAFGLHRFKELYLAERWTSEFVRTGHWPEDVTNRFGRVLWGETIALLSELARDRGSLWRALYRFCHERTVAFGNETPMVERYRCVEALISLGRMASNMRDGGIDRRPYYESLHLIHWFLLKESIGPSERVRLVRSLHSHRTMAAADLLLALHDDVRHLRDPLTKQVQREACLQALADLAAAGGLDDSRLLALSDRADSAISSGHLFVLAANSPAKMLFIKRRRARTVRSISARTARFVGRFLVYWALSFVAIQGVLGMVAASSLVLIGSQFARVTRRLMSKRNARRAARERQRKAEQRAAAEESVDHVASRQGVPYDSERYWLNFGEPGSPQPSVQKSQRTEDVRLRSYSIVSCIFLVAALGFAIVRELLTIAELRRWLEHLFSVWLSVAKYVIWSIGGLVAIGTVLAVSSVARARLRHARASRQLHQQWSERLRRVNEEGERLRADDVEIAYIIDHLLEGVDGSAAGIGVLQARLDAIRGRVIFDSATVDELRRWAGESKVLEAKKLLWKLIDDMTRVCVIEEEKRLYQQQ